MRRFGWGSRLAAALVVTLSAICLAGVGVAQADSSAPSATAPSPAASPSIVSQLAGKDTMYSNTYRLSNGSYQAQIFSQPIRFKDASGAWQSFDTSLVSAGVAGIYHAASTPVAITIGASGTAAGQPATLAAAGYTVTWTLQNASAGVPLAPAASTSSYLGALTDTTLSYKVLNWGIEQSLTLSSPAAPASFTCTLSHPGLTLDKDANGQWGLYAPGNPVAIFFLSGITVTDSATDTYGNPVSCPDAAMTVVPGSGSSTLTYTVPRAWLSATARVWPVTIDPTLTKNPVTGNSTPYGDTIVSSGNPGNSHGTSANLYAGKSTVANCTGYTRSLVGFDLSAIPASAYVDAATFSAYKWDSGGSTATTYLGSLKATWVPQSTWTSLGFTANDFSCLTNISRQAVAVGSWLSLDATSTVQDWLSGAQPNYGFALYQQESGSQDATYLSKFYSSDNASSIPKLVVNYDPAPAAAAMVSQSVFTWGDTASIDVRAHTYYHGDVSWIESGLNLASDSDSASWRGVVGWFRSAALVPSSAWHTDGTFTDGSVVAHYADASNPSDYGADKVTVDFSGCNIGYTAGTSSAPGYQRATFAVTIGSTFGAMPTVEADTRFGMAPAGATASWGSGDSLSGDLAHPAASDGWTAQPGARFAVINTAVNTLTSVATGSDWFNSASGADDRNDQGRGATTLMWPKVAGADGYHIYLNDGSGTYRQVGATLGGGSILWSSAGDAFYPGDSEIAGLSSPANAFYRATTPTDGYSHLSGVTTPSSLQATLTPSPAPSPSASPGDGVVVADGSSGQYVYEHRWGAYGGPTVWTKIGTGNGTTLGHNYGTVGPDISTIGGNAASAFYLGGYLYDGATTAATASAATVVGVNAASGATQSFSFSGGSPLNPASGSSITANAHNLLLASATDGEGATHIYSAAYTLSTNASDGSPRYDGYRFLDYDATGALIGDHSLGMTTGSSECSDGLLADGSFLYLIAWRGSSSAHVTKVSTTTWQIVNQWSVDQATTRAINGCYDQVNNRFWLGALDANRLYEYAGSGNANVGLTINGTQVPATNGFDLRDDPNALYQETSDGVHGIPTWTAYDFKVVPYTNASGVSTEATPAKAAAYGVAATLDNRTYSNNDDPQYTTSDLGSWDGHDVSARLNTGALQVATTDLSIATWGPAAQVSRTYLSSGTTANRFAPGWVFNFDQHLDLSNVASGAVDYYDAAGDRHHFVQTGSSWAAPGGFLGTLAGVSGSSWTITYSDGTVDTYSTTGIWQSEADRNGNTTTYAWSSGNLTITAANGQTIAVTCNASGQITKATYTTSAGSREIDYQTAAPWQVTYYAGSSVQRYLTYGYTSSRLSAVNQLNWPSSGSTASEAFLYSSGSLSEVDFPDYDATSKPDARATIAYASGSATISHYGTVGGSANQATKVETDSWSAQTGAQATQVESSASSSESSTTQFAYAANDQLADSVTMASNSSNKTTQQVSACDAKGNITAQSDGGVGVTTSAYTDSANPNLPTVVTDPNQDVVNNTYDSYGNLTSTQQTLNSSGDVSATQSSYDGQGRVTEQKQLISGTPSNNPVWAVTDYSSFEPNGQPQTTIDRAVQLSYGGSASDLSYGATYDAFGNLLGKTDPPDQNGTRTTETDTYDLAGEKLTSTDASGITANSSYDCLGYVTSSWRSASGTNKKDNWQSFVYDPMGRVLTQTTKLSDSSGTLTTQDVTTNTWDGVGNELTSTSSTLAGQAAKWTYDDQGNVTSHWGGGVYDYSAGRGTQDSYDSHNQVLSETVPGNTTATTTTYNPDGSVAAQTNPDGSFVTYGYDANGNKTAEVKPLHGYSSDNSKTATTSYTYDYGNRLTLTTEPNALQTSDSYDELGRQTSAQGASDPATNTTYNTLGWVLRKVDGDGVSDTKTFDTHGCVTSETIGSKTTTSTYDADNNLKTQTDADSNLLTNTYDAFGNLTEAKHTNSGGTVLKDTSTTVDSLGRPTSQTDAVSGLSHSWTYPVNTTGGIQETVSYDATPLTSVAINRNARNMETSRVATIAPATKVTRSVADPTSGRDLADRWIQVTLQETGYPLLTLNRSFDGAGRLSSQSGAGYTSGNSASYTYDPDTGLKTADSLPLLLGGAVSGSYSYDANQRLATDTVNGVAGSLTFDTLGNLTADTEGATTTNFSYNSANQLTQSVVGANTTVYGWNATNAWRTSQGPSGNPTQTQYGYNAQGRMATYANSATSTTASYTYDAAGQRTKSAVSVSGTTTTTNWAYDGITLMGLSAVQGSSSWRVDYLRDEEGTPYGGVYRSPATSTTPTYFTTITNDRGDVVELLDANGAAFANYHYDAWGLPTATTTQTTTLITASLAANIATRQVLRYAGYAYDAESGLYYCSARYYDPATRQFTSSDSAKANGEESAYQYCDGCPVDRTDARGTESESQISAPLNITGHNWYTIATWHWHVLYAAPPWGGSDEKMVEFDKVHISNHSSDSCYVVARMRPWQSCTKKAYCFTKSATMDANASTTWNVKMDGLLGNAVIKIDGWGTSGWCDYLAYQTS